MLTPRQNELLTRVGPGTQLGRALRGYWFPALLTEELSEPDGAPVRVRLLGEDLIAFRDSRGEVGLVSAYCPHRRAPMFFGRNEERGLRCVYHGWKFDRSGACVDMPSEPPDSLFKSKVRIEAYPTYEAGGIVWTYMGPPEQQPPQPNYELCRVPPTHRFVSKTYEDCNYLPALEGGIDSTHAAILHRSTPGIAFLRQYDQIIPRVEVQKTEYGEMFCAIRSRDGKQWVRVSHYIMPGIQVRGTLLPRPGRPVEARMDGHIWVPIDDFSTWVYNFTYSYFPDEELTRDEAIVSEEIQGRGPANVTADFRLKRNRSNDYEIDRQLQRSGNFTGIVGVNTQDYALQENMERIVDRTKEHVTAIDQPIIVARQLLLEAIESAAEGRPLRGTDPRSHAAVRGLDLLLPPEDDWQRAVEEKLFEMVY
jgi:phthalate 4,5-dioxygenase oxygenase subunit